VQAQTHLERDETQHPQYEQSIDQRTIPSARSPRRQKCRGSPARRTSMLRSVSMMSGSSSSATSSFSLQLDAISPVHRQQKRRALATGYDTISHSVSNKGYAEQAGPLPCPPASICNAQA
jgi:hypothetical protein